MMFNVNTHNVSFLPPHQCFGLSQLPIPRSELLPQIQLKQFFGHRHRTISYEQDGHIITHLGTGPRVLRHN